MHLIDQICCETNTLEDKYETGREILLSITINHDNITNFFAKIDEEYNHLSNIFNDQRDKGIENFIKLSKEQIVSEVNIQAHNLNKFSLDEQSKYEYFIRTNIQGKISTVNKNCSENNNSLNKILRCIDQYQYSKNKSNKVDDNYSTIKNTINDYNSILVSRIKDAENKFIAAKNKIISIEKIKNDEFIKRKSSISIPSTSSTNEIRCETDNLEDKFETGREIILSTSIHHENITSIFTKIDEEYDNLSNIFNDLNNKSINDFIDLSKKQIVMEVNNLAKTLNKFSIDEQSKYEDFVRTNTNTFKEKMPLFNNCLKNYNSLKKSLRCIDQHQITKNATDNEFYKNLKNLLDRYNTILIPKIKDIEKRFITAINEIIFIAKNTNDELINKKSSISLPSTSATNKNQEAEKIFYTCFYNNTRLDDVFECMGWLQPFDSIPKTLKLNYNEALKKFKNNKEFLSSRIFDCSYKSRDYFNQRLKHLNNQFDNCVQHQKSSDKCIEPTSDNFMPITLPPNTQIIELDFVTIKP
ncbi:hypothetical protein HCN44_001444 [Aphidius gifuensis]|uniref:Uncharacterized protein n=1 Tax=Aphidius gifuensis TaxID=684658 RepID=A0A835CQT4_APHGI|nr:hypothetical protein HCN44_001444 [Aphidius gifuensis]